MKYFMTNTPLAGLERQMMAPPNFKPRGHGRMILNRFRYKPEDVDCKLCTEYRNRRCIQPSCPWLEERVEAGVVRYQPLVMECFKELRGHPLMDRVEKLIRGRDGIHTEGESHKRRLSFWRSWLTQQHGKTIDHQPLAALYLLTARESLWNKAQPRMDDKKDNPCAGLSLRGIQPEDYALLQTVKVVCEESAGITIGDLADEEVVDDDTLRLIIDSALLCRYGQAALYLSRKED